MGWEDKRVLSTIVQRVEHPTSRSIRNTLARKLSLWARVEDKAEEPVFVPLLARVSTQR
jgi:hypothetical protein